MRQLKSTAVLALLFSLPADRLLAQDSSSGGDFWDTWQARASASQAEQPHWVTPVFTVTPRLEQEVRFDVGFRSAPDGTETDNIGNSKGLELIPATPLEVILNIPPYFIRHEPKVADGWGDFSALLKYRIASANEEHGAYIVTAFLGASFPTGTVPNGAGHAIITPTLALGKGIDLFDVQTTFGVSFPTSGVSTAGHPMVWNTAIQAKAAKRVWPEVEMNATFWPDGTLKGKNQIFVSPGLVLGRFPIHGRLGFTFGAGVQLAVSSFHQYDHGWIVTARLPF